MVSLLRVKEALLINVVRTMDITWIWPSQVVMFRMEQYPQASKKKKLLSPLADKETKKGNGYQNLECSKF